jgi:hypothetical protein
MQLIMDIVYSISHACVLYAGDVLLLWYVNHCPLALQDMDGLCKHAFGLFHALAHILASAYPVSY